MIAGRVAPKNPGSSRVRWRKGRGADTRRCARVEVKIRDQVRITPAQGEDDDHACNDDAVRDSGGRPGGRRSPLAARIASENAFVPTRQTAESIRPSSGRRVPGSGWRDISDGREITPEVFTISGRSSH
jgi:hypothetical protein